MVLHFGQKNKIEPMIHFGTRILFIQSNNMSTLNELSLALLNAQVNGSTTVSVDAALSAVQSRTDEINISVQGAPASEPEVQVLAPSLDEDQAWEDDMQAARALDEVEEAARTGMWADFDGPDNHAIEDDDDIDDDVSFSSYDDRQDRYYDDWNTGLDWNEGGYFD